MMQVLTALALAALLVVGSLGRAAFHQQRLESLKIHQQAEALLDALERYHQTRCRRYIKPNIHKLVLLPYLRPIPGLPPAEEWIYDYTFGTTGGASNWKLRVSRNVKGMQEPMLRRFMFWAPPEEQASIAIWQRPYRVFSVTSRNQRFKNLYDAPCFQR